MGPSTNRPITFSNKSMAAGRTLYAVLVTPFWLVAFGVPTSVFLQKYQRSPADFNWVEALLGGSIAFLVGALFFFLSWHFFSRAIWSVTVDDHGVTLVKNLGRKVYPWAQVHRGAFANEDVETEVLTFSHLMFFIGFKDGNTCQVKVGEAEANQLRQVFGHKGVEIKVLGQEDPPSVDPPSETHAEDARPVTMEDAQGVVDMLAKKKKAGTSCKRLAVIALIAFLGPILIVLLISQ